jgi:branched-chain amino acid transport system substrate-binding protein
MNTRTISIFAFLLASFHAGGALSQVSDDTIKIGVLTDMTGPLSDIDGPGGVAAAQMAIDEVGGMILGKKIELVSADTLNKPDVTVGVAGRWLDTQQVDILVGGGASSTALAMSGVAAARKKIFIATDPGTTDLTGKLCNPYTIHWTYDSYALANGTASSVVETGGKTWFMITADYAYGHSMEKDAQDFSSLLLQAQSSKAQIIGLANAGSDLINTVKQAGEFGITQAGQKLVTFAIFVTDIHSIGLPLAQGLQFTEAFYWDQNDGSRAFTSRFVDKMGRVPTSNQAGYYAAVKHYLKAVAASGTDNGDAVMATMKAMPTDDALFGKGYIRPDGRKIHDMYLFEVKSPAESRKAYDYYKLVKTIPGDQAFRPLAQSECSLVKKG